MNTKNRKNMELKKMLKKDLLAKAEELQKKVDRNIYGPVIDGNTITVKIFDDGATRNIDNITKALLNLTELYKATNVNVGTLLRVDNVDGAVIKNSYFETKKEL